MGILNLLLGSKKKQQTTGESETEQQQRSLTEQQQATTSKTAVDSITSGLTEQATDTQAVTTQDQITTRTGETTGTQQTRTDLFSENILRTFESLTAAAAGGVGGDSLEALQDKAVEQALNFDIGSFTESIVAGAGQELTDERQAAINALSSTIGGSPLTSSVASNFERSQERRDLTTLAAIGANVEATGQDIQRQNIGAAAGLGNLDLQNFLALATGLKGGTQIGTAASQATQTEAGTTVGTGTVAETGTTTTAAEQTQSSEQVLTSLIESILSAETEGTTKTAQTGTVDTSGRGSILDAIVGIIGATKKGG